LNEFEISLGIAVLLKVAELSGFVMLQFPGKWMKTKATTMTSFLLMPVCLAPE
jgi:hypothetical protein